MSDDRLAPADVDPLVHQPARLLILTILASVESVDFLYLQAETGLTSGNLSSHLTKLDRGGLITIEKTYRGKLPLTICRLTAAGRQALVDHREYLKHMSARIDRATGGART